MIRLHRIKAIIYRVAIESVRSTEKLTETFFWPLLDIFLWGLLTSFLAKDIGFSWVNAILGALILWTFMYNIQRDITLTVLTDVWDRNLYNIFSAPLKPIELILGSTCVGAVRMLASVLVVVPLSMVLFNLQYNQTILPVLWAMFSLLIFSLAFGCFAVGLVFKWGSRVQSVAWAGLFIIQPVSCVFYPLSSLPQSMQIVAYTLPTTYVFEGAREVMIQNMSLPSTLNFWMAPLLSFLYFIVGVMVFNWGYKKARQRGWLIQMD